MFLLRCPTFLMRFATAGNCPSGALKGQLDVFHDPFSQSPASQQRRTHPHEHRDAVRLLCVRTVRTVHVSISQLRVALSPQNHGGTAGFRKPDQYWPRPQPQRPLLLFGSRISPSSGLESRAMATGRSIGGPCIPLEIRAHRSMSVRTGTHNARPMRRKLAFIVCTVQHSRPASTPRRVLPGPPQATVCGPGLALAIVFAFPWCIPHDSV
jgi:hypothetical protein